jgi:hypothetical protein
MELAGGKHPISPLLWPAPSVSSSRSSLSMAFGSIDEAIVDSACWQQWKLFLAAIWVENFG